MCRVLTFRSLFLERKFDLVMRSELIFQG
eukprot:SAG11_NODE_35066_length_268_cov_1.207101_1_plen_28_part_01